MSKNWKRPKKKKDPVESKSGLSKFSPFNSYKPNKTNYGKCGISHYKGE